MPIHRERKSTKRSQALALSWIVALASCRTAPGLVDSLESEPVVDGTPSVRIPPAPVPAAPVADRPARRSGTYGTAEYEQGQRLALDSPYVQRSLELYRRHPPPGAPGTPADPRTTTLVLWIEKHVRRAAAHQRLIYAARDPDTALVLARGIAALLHRPIPEEKILRHYRQLLGYLAARAARRFPAALHLLVMPKVVWLDEDGYPVIDPGRVVAIARNDHHPAREVAAQLVAVHRLVRRPSRTWIDGAEWPPPRFPVGGGRVFTRGP